MNLSGDRDGESGVTRGADDGARGLSRPLSRRRFAATVVATSTAALAGCLDGGTDDTGEDAEETAGEGPTVPSEPPFEVTTVDAPGSEAGTMTVPASDRWILVNFSATQCPTSEAHLGDIDEARAELRDRYDFGPDGDLEVVSVVSGTRGTVPTTDELAAWWAEHDGAWTVGLDEENALFDYYDVDQGPSLALLDEDAAVRWSRDSAVSARTIIAGVDRALEDATDDADATDGDEGADAEEGDDTVNADATGNEENTTVADGTGDADDATDTDGVGDDA
ncbi:peroxiredoxin family protein [Halopiger goleimassiliensis]|uniref:peroxiredoxin family protein n=1 Tax=Halopiger goleimassiliensis TaxID=1293048 RepID=UPI0006778805|nr:hypothetical protein [Halopiger goleimassiliensis]